MLEPFKIAIPDDVLKDLSRRLGAVRLGSVEKAGWEEGTDPAYLANLSTIGALATTGAGTKPSLMTSDICGGTVDLASNLIHEDVVARCCLF